MTQTFITPQIVGRVALATLYNRLVLANLVSRDWNGDFVAGIGDTVTVRKPAVFTAKEFSYNSGIEIQDVTEDSTSVKLDTIADVSFKISSSELTMDIDDLAGRVIDPAMIAIAQKLDDDLANALVAAAVGSGGGGTIAMGGGHASDVFIKGREKLTRNKLPLDSRYAVLSPEAVSVALGESLFVEAQMAGTTDALRNANVGRAFGLDTYETGQYGYGPGGKGSADGVAFHRSAVTLVSRALEVPAGVAPNQVSVDSFMGISLRTVRSYDITKKTDVWSIDTLYGVKAMRPNAVAALDMGQGS